MNVSQRVEGFARRIVRFASLAGIAITASAPAISHATDPLRTALVVNGQSIDSLTIANHYADLRSIPELSIVVLDGVTTKPKCDVQTFRDQILKPLMAELDARGLGIQTDSIAYSAGFPTAIDLAMDLNKIADRHKLFTPVGSINGLTTLYQFVLTENPEYVSPLSNYYSRRDPAAMLGNPFLGTDRAVYDEAVKDAEEGRFSLAIPKAEGLAAKHPLQWPIRFRIAVWMNSADRTDDALAIFGQLVDSGIAYRKLFEDEPTLESLRKTAEFQKLAEKMPGTVPNRIPAVPFSGRFTYGINGIPLGDSAQGIRFLLSTVLAVTTERGTKVDEAIEILRRAAAADATGEPAEFFFSNSSDVRAKTRMPLVPVAAITLRELGHEVVIDTAPLPVARKRLMGAMLGSANYDWPSAGNTVLPGAILENLTSTSGVLHQNDGQTAMTELLRGGAAGTSGTVTEPYALQFKFPTPLIYTYYASGSTLAEAFYLSVESPYQLLIVGDPLCRPYGDEHNEAFSLDSAEDAQQVRVKVNFWRGAAALRRVAALEVFVDGKLVNIVPPTTQLNFEKAGLPPGEHELRIAAISRHPLRMRTIQSTTFSGVGEVSLPELMAEVKASSGEKPGPPIVVANISSIGATQVAVRHLGRRIAQADGATATLEIPADRTGYGPVRLVPESLVGETWVRGTPMTINVAP
jgi:hypothetical protein